MDIRMDAREGLRTASGWLQRPVPGCMYGEEFALVIAIVALAAMGLVQFAGVSLAQLFQHVWAMISGLW